MEELRKLDQEEHWKIDLKKFGIMDCESREVFRLDAERILACRSYNPICRYDGPCGDNTILHILSLINLATGKRKDINSYYSEWLESPKFSSNEEWCVDCIAKGMLEK